MRRGLRADADRRQAPADARGVRGADADRRLSSRARSRSRRAAASSGDACSIGSRSTRRPASLADGERYARGACARGSASSRRGATAPAISTAGRSSWCATASALSAARAAAAERARSGGAQARSRASARRGSSSAARYVPGAPADAEAFRAELARRRARDRARGVGDRRAASRRPRARARAAAPCAAWPRRGSIAPSCSRWSSAEIEVVGDGARRPPGAAPRRRLERARSRAHRGAASVLCASEHGQVLADDDAPGAHRRRGPFRALKAVEFSRCRRDDRRDGVSGAFAAPRTAIRTHS